MAVARSILLVQDPVTIGAHHAIVLVIHRNGENALRGRAHVAVEQACSSYFPDALQYARFCSTAHDAKHDAGDDVQSQSTSCSGDSNPIEEDRCKRFAETLSTSTLDDWIAAPKKGLIGDQSGIPAISGVQVKGRRQLNRWQYPFMCCVADICLQWRPSPQLRGTKIPTRDLRPLNNKNLKFLGVTVYGAVPQRLCPSRQIRQSDGSQNHFSFFAAPQPMSIGASSSRSNNDDNGRNGTSMRRQKRAPSSALLGFSVTMDEPLSEYLPLFGTAAGREEWAVYQGRAMHNDGGRGPL
ncbi:hypothetical protein EDD85DRAFT_796377 [Armillaria nabsnona]|nr:hypothetical protein EDD85DRAFT_796377 [Armillaria nabsnona]